MTGTPDKGAEVTVGKTPSGRDVKCSNPDMPTPLALFKSTTPDPSSSTASAEALLQDNEKFKELTSGLGKEAQASSTGMIALLTAQQSAPKHSSLSVRDIDSQHAKDIAPLDPLIKDSPESFLTSPFAIRRKRSSLKSW